MGKIEKIIKKGSVEGQTTEVYPVTSTKAVYDENNKRLDNIITGLQESVSGELNTISKKIVPAINEVNTLAKSKGNGTITEVRMNGVSKGTNGVVDLGTVLTEHQDISGKQDKTDNTLATTDKTVIGAINEINTKVGNLTGALTWKGKLDTLPAVTDYEAGNVVSVGNKEYVLTVTGNTKAWEELGDEGSYLLKSAAEETYAKKTDIPTIPAIPTVNNPKVSIKMNGVEKGSFTLNQVAAGEVDLGTVITAHQDISEKVDMTLNAKAFEAITIGITNSAEDKAANVATIKAYVENLKILGVDTTKGFNVPVRIRADDDFYGCLTGEYHTDTDIRYLGYYLSGTIFSVAWGAYYIKDIFIAPDGQYMELVNIKNDNGLSTTSKNLIGAINEVNILAKKKQDKLTSGTNIKTINGESVLGSGDITISGGASSSAYPEVNHGTGDTTFTLTPNTFHVWDEVTSLTLNFGNETSGVANEYLFQFTSGSTATSLTLPDSIKWANDNVPTIGANMIYQVSILHGLASVLEFNNAIV